MPQAPDTYFKWLQGLDTKDVKVYGCGDGRLVFAKEPLLRIEGPLAVLQLLETPLINLINFATLVCTNASRMKGISGEKVECIEFGLRRA